MLQKKQIPNVDDMSPRLPLSPVGPLPAVGMLRRAAEIVARLIRRVAVANIVPLFARVARHLYS